MSQVSMNFHGTKEISVQKQYLKNDTRLLYITVRDNCGDVMTVCLFVDKDDPMPEILEKPDLRDE